MISEAFWASTLGHMEENVLCRYFLSLKMTQKWTYFEKLGPIQEKFARRYSKADEKVPEMNNCLYRYSEKKTT